MFILFKKRPVQSTDAAGRRQGALTCIEEKLLAMQLRSAKWLSKQEQRMTLAQKKMALCLFCIVMATLACAFFVRGVSTSGTKRSTWLQGQGIILPENIRLPDSLNKDYQHHSEHLQQLISPQ